MTSILALIGGIVLWTFLEYVIHRFLGHKNKSQSIVRKEHLRHHIEGHYFAPMHKKIVASIIVFASVGAISYFFLNGLEAFFFTLGLVGMYIFYEFAHRFYHVREPLIRFGLKMRKHHFYHHFKNPKLNFGVTTRFWDRVFGTYHSTEQEYIPIPKKLMLTWLIDEIHTEIKSKYKPHFKVIS